MSRSKIIVVNYLSTGWLQALISNKPTIILWNKSAYQLSSKHRFFFNKLIESKIVHTDPIQAASFLKSIYDKPNIWWNKKETVEARNSFLLNNFMVKQTLEQTLINYSRE